MNNIYKVIWSKAKNCYVVASEIARSHTKSATGSGKIGGVTRRSLLASLMALSLLCGGLGVAEAAVRVNEDVGGTSEVYTTSETYTQREADLKYATKVELNAKGEAIATNTANITANKDAITRLENDKLRIDVASATYATKEALNGLTTVVNGKADKDAVTTVLDSKADTSLSNLTEEGKTAIKTTMADELAKKADAANVYTKDKVDEKLDLKANEAQVSASLNEKADKAALNQATDRITANEAAITGLTTKTTDQQTAIDDLKKKTAEISHEDGSGTNISGVTIKDGNIVGNGNSAITGLTNVETGSIKTDSINGKSLVGTNVATTTEVEAAVNTEETAREEADKALSNRIGTVADDGNYIKSSNTTNVSQNLRALDAQAKKNADNIQTNANDIKTNKDEIARVNGELVKTNDYFNKELGKTNDYFNKELGRTNDYFNKELSNTNNHFNTELGKTNAALQATNKRTAGIGRTDTGVEAGNQTAIEGKVYFDQNGNVSGVKDLQTDTIHATGEITSGGLDAKAGDIKTTGKVSAGDISTGTLETTGNATIGGDLTVNGKLNVDEISMKNDGLDLNGDQHHSATTITADGISNNAKVTDKNGVTTESKFTHDKEGSTTYAYKGDAADWKESTSNVTADGVENVAKDSKDNNNTFTQTSTDTKNILKDRDGNTSTTRQDSKGIYGYAKDKDGNKSYTKQEGNRIAESVIGQDGKQTKSEMTSTDITNTAKDGTITNTAKNVTNEGTESVTNKVGANEVKVSTNGVDITAEAGKKIRESVGTASRVVENAKITDNAGDSTVTTEKDKGTTFGKEGSTGTTNIYGNSIRTGTINAEDTTTAKLTAGAAAGADGGRLTVDASDGVKGSYKFGDYTSRSYILANTLKSGVDNGKEPIDADFVGSRTDHYMDEDKAKLDETVKDADGSNVTNKTSTGTVTTIKAGDKENTVTSTADGTTFNNSKANTAFEGGTYTDTTIKGNTITTGKVTMDYAEVMKDLGVGGNANIAGTTTTKTLNVTQNATVGGTLDVTGKATFHNDVDITGDVTARDVTARSYKVGSNTYIDENGINANYQKITNVADGSISEGSKDAVNGGQLYDVKRDMEHKVDKVGANAAAMANLRPMEFDPSSKWNIAAAIGNYGSETAAALGAFYRPNDDVMVNLSTAFGTGENMVGGGVSVRLGKGGNKLSREENNALKAQVDDLTARMDALLSVLNPNMSKDFPDVPENHWAYEAVSRLAGNDIVQGYPDGEFHGERTMTRYEMAEIIYNALSRGAEAERELVEEFKPELQAMAASEKATAERAEG